MGTRKRLHTSRPIWASESADVVETAMIEIDTEGHEYREREKGMRACTDRRAGEHVQIEGADNNPKGLRASSGGADGLNPDGAEDVAGHEAVL